jgi:hypothetical protein
MLTIKQKTKKKKKVILEGFLLYFMLYKSFEKKKVFDLVKNIFLKVKKKHFGMIFFFFGFIVNISYL